MPSNSVDVSSRSSAYAMGSDIAQAARAIRLTAPIVAQYGEFLAAMPVEIISFEVTEVTGHHKIYWKTTSEVNLDFYQVQYSHNLKDWATIETMEATGSFDGVTSYESVHKPFQRSNFYRIRGVDFNGDEHLSEIKSMTDEATPLTIFPNPTDGEVTIISNQVVEKLEIYDITGQRMLIPPVFSKDGAVTVSVATFLPGTYIIEAYCSAAIIRDRLLIK